MENQKEHKDRLIVMRPEEHAVFNSEKMAKSTLFRSEHVLVGLNAFEPGQEHALHAHAEMDKIYYVVSGRGLFLLDRAPVVALARETISSRIRARPASPFYSEVSARIALAFHRVLLGELSGAEAVEALDDELRGIAIRNRGAP